MWLISVPAWGDHVDIFEQKTLPTLHAATRELNRRFGSVHIIVHTDQQERIERLSRPSLPVFARPLPPGPQWFHHMSNAHREVIAAARPGDKVVLLTADMVISCDALTACRSAFGQGRKLVCCNATRTVLEDFEPFTRDGRALSEWGWKHRHPIVGDCTWPDGRMQELARIYFDGGESATCRLWLPHPLAFIADGREVKFEPTVDCDLVCCYRREEIHLVTSPDDLAVIELSPRAKRAGARDANEAPEYFDLPPMRERYDKATVAHPIYAWFLAQRITVYGDGEGTGDDVAVHPLLRRWPIC